jgi:hypothetical protein
VKALAKQEAETVATREDKGRLNCSMFHTEVLILTFLLPIYQPSSAQRCA